jgi:hypothetical protein
MRHMVCPAFFLAGCLAAQNTGRFADLIARGHASLEAGKYNQAVNSFEEVWEQDQSDPSVAEGLAMAYLYADRDALRSKPLAELAIGKGGRATFFVQHSHEKIGFLPQELINYCKGKLSISPGRLAFASRQPDHSFTLSPADWQPLKPDDRFGEDRKSFFIRTADKKKQSFRAYSGTEQEKALILSLIEKHVR